MVILAVLSEQPIGQEFVYIDVGLCALFGEFLHWMVRPTQDAHEIVVHGY